MSAAFECSSPLISSEIGLGFLIIALNRSDVEPVLNGISRSVGCAGAGRAGKWATNVGGR